MSGATENYKIQRDVVYKFKGMCIAVLSLGQELPSALEHAVMNINAD